MPGILSRKPFISILLAILIISFAVVAVQNEGISGSSNTIQITASFYPLAEFAKQVGGDKVTVTNITPPGSEPHDFDPTPKDIGKVYSSKIFIWSGSALEPWAPKVLSDLSMHTFQVVNASQGINMIGSGNTSDPHFWLDPSMAKVITQNIKDQLTIIDPGNAVYYMKNADAYTMKLDELNRLFQQKLASCKTNKIISTHQVFNYLARHYGFAATAITGLSPDEEPSPAKLAEIANLIKRDNIKYILTETLVSPKLAETLANETGAKTLTFNPVEGLTPKEISAGKNYISIQQDNINNLATALECNPK